MYLKNCIYLFTFGCAGSSLLCEGFLWLQRGVLCFSRRVQASHCAGFSCGAQALGRAGFSSCSGWAQQSWHTALVVAWHVKSSRTWDWTYVPGIGRGILNHWTTREAPPTVSTTSSECTPSIESPTKGVVFQGAGCCGWMLFGVAGRQRWFSKGMSPCARHPANHHWWELPSVNLSAQEVEDL